MDYFKNLKAYYVKNTHTMLKVLMAQINPTVGAISANQEKIAGIIQAKQAEHDVILFPELSLTGYLPEDYLFRLEFHKGLQKSLAAIQVLVQDCYVLVGHPMLHAGECYNAVSVMHQGKIVKTYHKQHLPNYGVFDEARYFKPGTKRACSIEVKGYKLGICLCEDLWKSGPVEKLINQGVDAIFSLNASPFDYDKQARREALLREHAKKGVAMFYLNQVGGQDDLIYDGQSFAMDKHGLVKALSPACEEDLATVTLVGDSLQGKIQPALDKYALIYKALVLGVRDYVEKNRFPGVLIGLSGGIDSALTLCIAVDALGAARVQAILMPSRFSAAISLDYALEQAKAMQVPYSILSIEPAFKTILDSLAPVFPSEAPAGDTTEENIQARIRGLFLMALSNKTGKMVLSTSNKSETAVGYATLYGDMAGGFAAIKDVLKTQVYSLVHYRNSQNPVIPQGVIDRPPSAELRENQKDEDSLPDYAILDAILVAYMEYNESPEEIVKRGFAKEVVDRVIYLLKRNEYKRRQAAPGIKISPKVFGREWRYPITHGFY